MSLREFIQDVRQLGFNQALYQQHCRSKYPEVSVVAEDGLILRRGLLTQFDSRGYCLRVRTDDGYVYGSDELKDRTIVSDRGVEVTPEMFRDILRRKGF